MVWLKKFYTLVIKLLMMVAENLQEKAERYFCKYCRIEFQSEEDCRFHEENTCSLNPNLLKDKNPLIFVKFLIISALTVAALAFAIFSPIILYLILLSCFPPTYSYIALGIFWVLIFGLPMFFAIVVDYISKKKD